MLATFKEEELPFVILGISPTGVIHVKNLLLETVDTPVTANWVPTAFTWGTTVLDLDEFAQGSRYTRYGDLFG